MWSCAGSAVKLKTEADETYLAFLVMVLCLAIVRTLLLIDATALWSDELYSVGKRLQSSFMSMLAMLREDNHPPAYYSLLDGGWSWWWCRRCEADGLQPFRFRWCWCRWHCAFLFWRFSSVL